eukprot:4137132-Prymnesium_polylepis.1
MEPWRMRPHQPPAHTSATSHLGGGAPGAVWSPRAHGGVRATVHVTDGCEYVTGNGRYVGQRLHTGRCGLGLPLRRR